jgi:hypothetical protein
MTIRKIITISLIVTVIHFFLTSLIGHYIAVQVGSQLGKIVAEGLIESSDNKANAATATIYQNMKTKSEEIERTWKIPELLISLPAKPLINPLLKDIKQNQINRVISKEISRDQFRTQGLVIHYSANFLNSLSLGFLVYIILRILSHYKTEKITSGSTADRD